MTNELPKGFYHLTVSDVRRETDGATSVAFDVPENLSEEFSFKPGQYLTLMREGEAPVRRPYSICTSPRSGELRVCAKLVPNGEMSSFINAELQVGDTIAVRIPTGRFTLTSDETLSGHYVFIAAGSGITPVLSHITALLEQKAATATLFYGNRSRADIIFRDALLDLKNSKLGRLAVHHVLSRERADAPLFEGRLDEERVSRLVQAVCPPDTVEKYLICGPGQMMEAAAEALEKLGVDRDQILLESFGTHEPVHAPPVPQDVEKDATATTMLTIHGELTELQVPYDKAVLDVALDAGLDIPFACKGGVCCTCKARLIEGDVIMPTNYGLEPDEIERGFILTCQAIPRSEKLVVDYDAV